LAFKNGLYIFLLRQFFRGIPDELEESAYMDGCGTFRTFIQIILPLSIPMMVTVFLFAFCWQWTDDFYISLINTGTMDANKLLVDLVGEVPESLKNVAGAGQQLYETAIRNTCGLMIIAPLVVLYAFCQNFLVQGIEQSGLAN
jgi:multiple sugar transport system permease protein